MLIQHYQHQEVDRCNYNQPNRNFRIRFRPLRSFWSWWTLDSDQGWNITSFFVLCFVMCYVKFFFKCYVMLCYVEIENFSCYVMLCVMFSIFSLKRPEIRFKNALRKHLKRKITRSTIFKLFTGKMSFWWERKTANYYISPQNWSKTHFFAQNHKK